MDLLRFFKVPTREELEHTYELLEQSSSQDRTRIKRRRLDMAAPAPPLPGLISIETTLPERPASRMSMDVDLSLPGLSREAMEQATSHAFTSSQAMKPQAENLTPTTRDAAFAALGLESIDDFDKQHAYEPSPKPQLVPLHGGKGNFENVMTFHNICHRRGIHPEIEYQEPLPFTFTATAHFGSQSVSTTTSYPSKKQAKEAVCKIALDQLRNAASIAGSKRSHPDSPPEVDQSEDWISILVQYAQKNKIPHAQYQESATDRFPVMFGCKVILPGGPDTPFGADLGPFPTKKGAKWAAAKEAVVWLRANGMIPQDSEKQQQILANKKAIVALQQAKAISATTSPSPVDSGAENISPKWAEPATIRLHRLVVSLGFCQPHFDVKFSTTPTGEPCTAAQPFHDACVRFLAADVAKEPRLAGPIGAVTHVFGQKKAKEACYEQALRLLETIRRERAEKAGQAGLL